MSRGSACGIVGDMNRARTRIFLAAWAVPSLAFAVIVGIGSGAGSAVMALIGAALIGAVIYLFLRAVYPANRG